MQDIHAAPVAALKFPTEAVCRGGAEGGGVGVSEGVSVSGAGAVSEGVSVAGAVSASGAVARAVSEGVSVPVTVSVSEGVSVSGAVPVSVSVAASGGVGGAGSGAEGVDVERGWSSELVRRAEGFDGRGVLTRAATGVALSALFGLALGARSGGWALVSNALSVPLAFVGVCLVGVPALFIAFAFLDAPIEPKHMATTAARALATGGLVLAGLAPAAALFIVTTESASAAALTGTVGLLFGAAFGLRSLLADVLRLLRAAPALTQLAALFVSLVFGVFAVLLSSRIIESIGSLYEIAAQAGGAS